VIAPPGPSYRRCVDAVKTARAIGATTIASVHDDDGELAAVADHVVRLPAAPEALTPLVHVVPLQLLSYHLALARGTDPDSFHLDDPRHRRARAEYSL
jgi:glucosamine--fructose-6-phosphate aminotransferase (isomerizing)